MSSFNETAKVNLHSKKKRRKEIMRAGKKVVEKHVICLMYGLLYIIHKPIKGFYSFFEGRQLHVETWITSRKPTP
jgi:hypothetical protein